MLEGFDRDRFHRYLLEETDYLEVVSGIKDVPENEVEESVRSIGEECIGIMWRVREEDEDLKDFYSDFSGLGSHLDELYSSGMLCSPGYGAESDIELTYRGRRYIDQIHSFRRLVL